MTIIKTTNYFIFSSNELSKQYQWSWELTPYRPNNGIRNVDETNPNPSYHSREVLTIILDGISEVWEKEQKKPKEIGDQNTYSISYGLKTVLEDLVKDIDPDEEIISINFPTTDSSKYFPDGDVYIIIKKEDILQSFDDGDGKPLIIHTGREIRNSRDEVDQFIRDRGETIEVTHQNPQTWVVNTPSFTIQEFGKIGDVSCLLATSSFFVNGQEVKNINIISDSPVIKIGNTIKINGVKIGLNQSRIVGENIDILTHFDNVEEIIAELPNNNNPENQPDIQRIRDQAIQLIKQALLTQEKYTINNNDLDEKNWEILINSSNDINYIENLREKILANIRGKRREKINNNQLSELVKKGQKTENYEELKKLVEQIEKYRGEENYKLLKSEINAIKVKLAEKNPNKYRDDNVKMIEEEIRTKGVERNELDPEVEKELERLEKGEITNSAEIDVSKNKISDNISQINAKKKLGGLIKEYENATDENAKKNAKKKLFNFISNKNSFYREAYASRKSEVQQILGINPSYQPTSSKLLLVMFIGIFFLFLIGSAIIVRQRKINQKKK